MGVSLGFSRRVLVTGATGNLGLKAIAALRALGDVEVIGIADTSVTGLDIPVTQADLSQYDPKWASAFSDIDVVLHLAADPRPTASWTAVLRHNIDLSLNVLRAAEEHGVGRLVFASSNWVLGGYRFSSETLTPDTPPRPVNPYGVSKLTTERAGAALAARGNTSFLALRLGWCQPGENRPGPHMSFGRWGQQMWLSNDDWARAVQRACTAPFKGFAVVNVMSDNAGSRWDLSESERVIGYRPQSRHTPQLTVRRHLTDLGARLRDRLFPWHSGSPILGARW